MASSGAEESNKDLEAQNKQLQEEARKQVEADQQKKVEAAIKVAQGQAPEPDYTFQAAAKELEETPQPPNMGSATEDKARAAEDKGGTPPPQTQTTTEPPRAPRTTRNP